VVELAKAGRLSAPPMTERPLSEAQNALDELRAGRVVGRQVLVV
jgi:D-arabinose 1-dehydrogenase-like Zn-dependent alcohol dehydrogenase